MSNRFGRSLPARIVVGGGLVAVLALGGCNTASDAVSDDEQSLRQSALGMYEALNNGDYDRAFSFRSRACTVSGQTMYVDDMRSLLNGKPRPFGTSIEVVSATIADDYASVRVSSADPNALLDGERRWHREDSEWRFDNCNW